MDKTSAETKRTPDVAQANTTGRRHQSTDNQSTCITQTPVSTKLIVVPIACHNGSRATVWMNALLDRMQGTLFDPPPPQVRARGNGSSSLRFVLTGCGFHSGRILQLQTADVVRCFRRIHSKTVDDDQQLFSELTPLQVSLAVREAWPALPSPAEPSDVTFCELKNDFDPKNVRFLYNGRLLAADQPFFKSVPVALPAENGGKPDGPAEATPAVHMILRNALLCSEPEAQSPPVHPAAPKEESRGCCVAS